jgi:hypothetical protein
MALSIVPQAANVALPPGLVPPNPQNSPLNSVVNTVIDATQAGITAAANRLQNTEATPAPTGAGAAAVPAAALAPARAPGAAPAQAPGPSAAAAGARRRARRRSARPRRAATACTPPTLLPVRPRADVRAAVPVLHVRPLCRGSAAARPCACLLGHACARISSDAAGARRGPELT